MSAKKRPAINAEAQRAESCRDSREDFRRIMEKAPMSMAVVSMDGVIEYINQKAIETFGYLPGDIPTMERWWVQAYPDEDYRKEVVARWMGLVEKAIAENHEIEGGEYRVTCKGGSVKTVFIFGVPVANKVFVMFEDITERKRAEVSLKESEDKYRRLHESMMDAFVSVDMQGRITGCNRAFEQMLGYTEEELRQLTYVDLTPVKWHPIETIIIREQILPRGYSDIYEKEYRRKDGTVFPIELRTFIIPGADSRPVAMCAIVRDISGRKQAEEALRKARDEAEHHVAELAAIMDAVPVTIFVAHDVECRMMSGNRVAQELLEMSATANVSKTAPLEQRPTHFRAMKDGREIPSSQLPVQVAARGQPVRGYEFDFVFADGRTRTVLGDAVPLLDGRGLPYGAVGAFVDITERKRIELLLRQTVENLKRSNKELEHFAYVASHDLQEPLRMVTAFTGLLRNQYQDKLDARAGEYIDFALEGATRMQALIADLLAYSRVDAKARRLAPTTIGDSLDAALDNLKTTLESTGARITRDALPVVTGDGPQLTQLFQNLIDNAIKYRKADAVPEIHVGVTRRQQEWLFSVRDNGIGIDPQFNARIFEIFQRLHTRAQYPGTGIGLAICEKIVLRHGGRIWVESEPGQGATFFFTLPA